MGDRRRNRWDVSAAGRDGDGAIAPIEHELTLSLERAHELAERAKRSNGAVQQEIERARAIADELSESVTPPWRRSH